MTIFFKSQNYTFFCNVHLKKNLSNLDIVSQDKSKGGCNVRCIDIKKKYIC